MLKELQFVQGAVARKDFQPALVHFHIHNGKIQGYNGVLSLGCPIALDLDVTPNAIHLVKAVRSCTETIALSMTAGGRLAVKSGRFKAFIDCHAGGFPEIHPTGRRVELPTPILPALKVLQPCVAEDASRQWARGVLFLGESMFATNNVVLIERHLGVAWPLEMNLPLEAVNEVLRIGEEPQYLLAEENSVTFCYSGDRWLRTQLYTSQWPDVAKVLDGESAPSSLPFGAEEITAVLPFLDDGGRLYFLDGVLATSREDGIGARVEVPGLKEGGVFNAYMLQLAMERADSFDFSKYPGPCKFFGSDLRGALIGMRE
jgi:DNA polymerase III sliding clamp (beta) subunit (PCNA family)